MRKLTLSVTLLAICWVIGMSLQAFMVPLTGLTFGLFFASPLAVTLAMSKLLRGTATQSILLASALGYSPLLAYLFQVIDLEKDGFQTTIFFNSISVMALLWLTAGFTSKPSLQNWEERFLALRNENETEFANLSPTRFSDALDHLNWSRRDVFQDSDVRIIRYTRLDEEIFTCEQPSSNPKLIGTPALVTEVLVAVQLRSSQPPESEQTGIQPNVI
ncbi:hypothetical protein OVA24_08470 [Luteolibacter sp. SL250]|uniref:hypothetical protein n=1 Tax=Luteolibacter sp. SL250 TaxID=2995170 RepID=UPI00227110A3|nr:hypothetical protein [Luteolibacter sp. SL250]WAC21419.1 hypothetical protein OVA24_08470 [Luteolibacter sp. SL250]